MSLHLKIRNVVVVVVVGNHMLVLCARIVPLILPDISSRLRKMNNEPSKRYRIFRVEYSVKELQRQFTVVLGTISWTKGMDAYPEGTVYF